MNPKVHRKVWNTLRLTLTIAEAHYIIFYDYKIENVYIEEVSQKQYNRYNYSLN